LTKLRDVDSCNFLTFFICLSLVVVAK